MLLAGVLFAAGVLGIGQSAPSARSPGRHHDRSGRSCRPRCAREPSVSARPRYRLATACFRPRVYLGVGRGRFRGVLGLAVGPGGLGAYVGRPAAGPARHDRAVGLRGGHHGLRQRPFEMRGVLTGSAIVIVGAVVLWLAAPSPDAARALTHPGAVRCRLWIAVRRCVARADLAWHACARCALRGAHRRDVPAAWTMLGFESAAGWMPVAAALLALTAVLEAGRGAGSANLGLRRRRPSWRAPFAMPLLAATTLHTWNQWIPADRPADIRHGVCSFVGYGHRRPDRGSGQWRSRCLRSQSWDSGPSAAPAEAAAQEEGSS